MHSWKGGEGQELEERKASGEEGSKVKGGKEMKVNIGLDYMAATAAL